MNDGIVLHRLAMTKLPKLNDFHHMKHQCRQFSHLEDAKKKLFFSTLALKNRKERKISIIISIIRLSFSAGVAKMVDIDPLGSMGLSKGSIKA
ncbi:hypothetical protein T05_4006 [Trichinella murrelli]|uniref:Uncharacterized protein n=1 Tax=Trichinella murrelli TaxID=144512 RepID=A0A0V0T4V3_9BILA|nr:hypothetical protein T05_4006 [Trichinella murrelli]